MRGIGNESKNRQSADRDPENSGNGMLPQYAGYGGEFSGHRDP
jgi:hypothetical protein